MEHEAILRLGIFLGLFAVFACAEALAPRRARTCPRSRRWITNVTMSVINTLTLRLMAVAMPLLAIGAALDAGRNGWGLLNRLDWPGWAELLLAVLALDLALWAQHLLTHKWPLLWRLHRVHHADRDMDVTTAIRFHPVEIALSMLVKIGLVYLLGADALAVLLFEILLNGTALFTHANLALPRRLDAVLRLVIVTPDMHRVHHSRRRVEHDSNYGFALSVWDRLFGTYRARPDHGHDRMTIGLHWQDDRPARLDWSLTLPFRDP
ncbi:sterol desaturase family protein [Pukyongiella litopenaei]|uniref:Sterol desaturase family protein n=1 Tax=Pukyongiella litopenaei TaxID=2605946 RepID=A0A2S0MR10_9RHOB|nr:sterol desaturase family protein [Pukyongiella litopenaei]AVO38329.1 sterol desaturase family protein [Pukyongiella litopenaei]